MPNRGAHQMMTLSIAARRHALEQRCRWQGHLDTYCTRCNNAPVRVHVLATRRFARDARKAGLSREPLREAVAEMRRGLIDADLGGGLVKKRLARAGQGREAAFAAWWPPTAARLGSFCISSLSRRATTSARARKRH